jgi:hypothetical protein
VKVNLVELRHDVLLGCTFRGTIMFTGSIPKIFNFMDKSEYSLSSSLTENIVISFVVVLRDQ